MIAEAWKNESAWTANDGTRPRTTEWIDTLWESGEIDERHRADAYHWNIDGNGHDITHWRYHTPVDTILPAPTRPAPAMPACKPSRPDKIGKLSDEDILAAFNKLTGSELSEDAYNTLLSLQEMFDGRG